MKSLQSVTACYLSRILLTFVRYLFYSLHIFFLKIPGEQDSEAVKPGKKTLETVKGVGVFLAFFCLS